MKLFKAFFITIVVFATGGVFASSGDSVQQFYTEGLQALKSGDAEKAVALLSQAIALKSQEACYYNDRGVAHKRLGDLDKALVDYTTAIQMRPGYTHALNNRGLVYLEQGKYDLAIADFSEALNRGELQSRIYTNMGLAKAKQGNHQGAIKDFDKAFSYQPMDHRSFLFMAESLEKTGELEKALRTYQLARSLLKDPEAKAVIESRIHQLEVQKGLRPIYGGDLANKPQNASQPLTDAQALWSKKPRPQLREIARAQPFPDASVRRQETNQTREALIDSYHTLDETSRNKAMGKYSGPAREIYRQGQEFATKADATKALIRFEDARQLERRNKNVFAVAWSDIEIARLHKTLGDYVRADAYLRDALRLFETLKAHDQVILTLIELAETNKHLMEKEKTASFYQMARDKASALGYEAFAQEISELATGKKARFEKKRSAEIPTHSRDSRESQPEVKSATPHSPDKVTEPRPVEGKLKDPGAASSISAQRSSLSGAPRSTQKPLAVETKVQPASARSEHSRTRDEKPLIFSGPQQVASKPATPAANESQSISGKTPSSDGSPEVKREGSVGTPAKKPDKSQLQLPAPPASRHRALAQERGVVPKLAASNARSNGPGPKEPSLQDDLTLLRELRKRSDTQKMVPVLERLGRRYFETGNFEKSVHAYSAAIDLREKFGITDAMEAIFEARAASRESLGSWSEAMEDLARSLYLQQNGGRQPDRHLMDRLTKVSRVLGIERDAMIATFQLLWNTRGKNDSNGELQALLTIAAMYDRVGKFSQALSYYDRAAASVTANKAQILEKMGDDRLAEQQWTQALEALRNLDYSAYIHIMKQSKVLGARATR